MKTRDDKKLWMYVTVEVCRVNHYLLVTKPNLHNDVGLVLLLKEVLSNMLYLFNFIRVYFHTGYLKQGRSLKIYPCHGSIILKQ